MVQWAVASTAAFFPDPDGISPLSVNPHYYPYGHYGHYALIPVIMAKYG